MTAGEASGERGLSLGLRYMIASALCFSVMSVLVKVGGRLGFDSAQLVLARTSVALVLSFLSLYQEGLLRFWEAPHRGLLITRGVLGYLGLNCFFYAVTVLPLPDATVIQYTNPLLVTVLAALWLKERMSWRVVAGLALSLLGIVWIAQPSFLFGASRLNGWGVAAAICGAVLSACSYTVVRALKGRAEPMMVVFYFPLIATPLSIPPAVMTWVWPDWRGWLVLLGIGVATQTAQVFMTRGLHLESASRATSVTTLQVVFALFWGVTLFGELPTSWALLGMALVLGGVIIVSTRRG